MTDTLARAAAGSSHDHGNCELCDELERTRADAVAQAVKPWQDARQVQVDALHRLGLLGSPVEELERMTEEIARLRGRIRVLDPCVVFPRGK